MPTTVPFRCLGARVYWDATCGCYPIRFYGLVKAMSTQFRMKLTNKPNMSDHVDLASLGLAAKAWSELLTRATTYLFDRAASSDDDSSTEKLATPSIHFVVKRVEVASLDISSEPAIPRDEPDLELGTDFWIDVYGFLAGRFGQMEEGIMPEDIFPHELIQPARDLITTFSQNGIGRLQFGLDDKFSSELTWDRAGQLVKTSIRERSIGTVDGVITSISLSNKPQFGLRPRTGNIIACHFNRDKMLDEVTSAFLKRASIFGVLTRDERGRALKVTNVRSIEILPEDDDTRSVLKTAGAIPEITGDLSTAEWLRRHRGEE